MSEHLRQGTKEGQANSMIPANAEKTSTTVHLSAESLLDETISALTAADAERLESLAQQIEDRSRGISCPGNAAEAQRTAAKQRLLRQLLWETAGNLRLLRRILAMGESAIYGYGQQCGEPRFLPLTIYAPGIAGDTIKESTWPL